MAKISSPDVSLLQQRLKEKLSEAGLSVHALEKQAGLKRSAVQNILHGRSKKPSAQILQAVAKILGCDINELLSTHSATHASFTNSAIASAEQTFNARLYTEAAQVAGDILQQAMAIPSTSQALFYIQEIYQYSVETNKTHIDNDFALWLANKTFLAHS